MWGHLFLSLWNLYWLMLVISVKHFIPLGWLAFSLLTLPVTVPLYLVSLHFWPSSNDRGDGGSVRPNY